MITLFESFNPINIGPYISKDNSTFRIPSFNFEHFGQYYVNNINTTYNVQIKYNSLMRFYLYMVLLNYNGNDPIILDYIQGIKDKDPLKIEIINKIPNNKIVMKYINDKFGFGYPIDYAYSDLQDLKKLIYNYDKIFTDENIVTFIEKVSGVTKDSKKGEKIVKGTLNVLFGRYYTILDPTTRDDLKGVDLWMVDKKKGERRGVQVKNISNTANFNVDNNIITIDNTSLDLHFYVKGRGPLLPYDYLVFFIDSEKKICVIKSTAIISIIKNDQNFKITLADWAMEEKFKNSVFKYIDIPKKLLPKDFSKVFY